jgi:serine/threonine protein kinase
MQPEPSIADLRDVFALVGSVLAHRYHIDRVVAAGGFGVVYAARDDELDVTTAIKVALPDESLSPAQRRESFKKFVREARTVARLDHPHIVRVKGVNVAVMPSGVAAPWMALQWLDGHTLKDELNARRERGEGAFAPAEAFALLRPVIDAVAYAHEEDYAHRDLKPANIMLVQTRRGVVAYVLDFGIAKPVPPGVKAPPGDGKTNTSTLAFTAAYAAPEQVSGAETGPWTDVHALALILTELVLGARGYQGDSPNALIFDAVNPSRPTPARFNLDVGPLEPVLARALALRPADRFDNARAFLDALDAVIEPAATPCLFGGPRVSSRAPQADPIASGRRLRAGSTGASQRSAPAPEVVLDPSSEKSAAPPAPKADGRRVILWTFIPAALVATVALVARGVGPSPRPTPRVTEQARPVAVAAPPSVPSTVDAAPTLVIHDVEDAGTPSPDDRPPSPRTRGGHTPPVRRPNASAPRAVADAATEPTEVLAAPDAGPSDVPSEPRSRRGTRDAAIIH